jgi:hypothetical protein
MSVSIHPETITKGKGTDLCITHKSLLGVTSAIISLAGADDIRNRVRCGGMGVVSYHRAPAI